ncbi:MAG TPA: LuxR C-terminal-related transcriptional regulator [Gemmatimonadales bacterium]|nr:LuxR C-terminal-related transcriptional regulator [Gemmatimonadales bacterium]
MACWWLEDYGGAIDARERAYRLFRQADDPRAAARVAVWLSIDYADFRGESAVANGWIQRAERLLDGLPPSPEHALLAYHKAHVALMGQRNPVAARRLSQEAAAIARSVGPADMEMLGIALEGLAMVTEGEVAAGMSRLDEATAAATAGELSDPAMIGTACCYLIRACEQVHDYDRAAQWCERVREFCRRWKFTGLFSACRIQYASLLTLRGEWAEAEREIEALRRHVERVQPRVVPIALIRLGDLRRRQGRWEEADHLFAESESHYLAVLGSAALALDRGESAKAAELAEEYLRRVPPDDRTERVAGLDIIVRARAAEGEREQAAAHLEELRTIAVTVGTEPLQATVAHAEGCLLSASGDHKAACSRFEESATLFDRNRTPFEAARSRLQLAHTLLALGRRDPATIALRAAGTAFEQLGAARQAAAARILLQELDLKPHGPIGVAAKLGRLTPREIEVLRLVAQGLSDKESAARLKLSEHTIHRHVGNILTKTGLPSRAAAVAQAARSGLL